MKTEVLSIASPAQFETALTRAVAILSRGGLVALPTETVYGLAANALAPAAVAQIFQVKGRPSHNPIIVHVSGVAMAGECAERWPPTAAKLAAAFWPGPLTLVVPRSARIPGVVTAGGATVGLRWPAHPFMQAVIQRCGFPLAAPSANRSNRLSPTTAEHVRCDLEGRIELVVDGGPTTVGIESTVVDVCGTPARILRPGMIHEGTLEAVLPETGVCILAGETHSGPLASPGLLRKHYAPKARLAVLAWQGEAELHQHLARLGFTPSQAHVLCHHQVPGRPGLGGVCVMPHEPSAYARSLYAELHRCDAAGARWIVVEALPDEPAWRGVADRLRRAAAAEAAPE